MTDEDFEALIGPVKKWDKPNFVPLRQQIRSQIGLSRLVDDDTQDNLWISADSLVLDIRQPVEPDDILSFKRDGIQLSVFRKLRLGQYAIQDRVDLHRMRAHQAAGAVARLLNTAYAQGLRTVLITHGKGAHSNPPCVLKSLVNQWLMDIPQVLAFHSAAPQHGGCGAVYVMVKKNKESKDRNRSLHGQ